MLATVIALHLAAAQAPAAEPAPEPAREVVAPLPDRKDARPAREAPPAPEPDRAAGGEEAGGKPAPAAAAEEEELKTGRGFPPPVTMKTRSTVKALSRIPSLLSAEPLGGRSAVLGWVGWSSLGAGWAQGVTPEDDLGAVADVDWSTGELRLGAFYRRPMGRVGWFDLAARLRAGWWADFGAKWFHDDNRSDRGVEAAPGLVVSARGAGGVFSLAGDLPIVFTLRRDGGIFAAPKLSLAYETLLYGDLTVGIRVGGAYRAGAGDAPMSDPRALLELQVLAGWRLF